jgi:hypothetical protein
MNTILVSYDLHAPGRDYTKLLDHLKSYDTWANLLESVWLLKTDSTTAQVRDAAAKHIDQNDTIFAVDVTGRSWGSWNLSDEVVTWIKSNM